MFQPQIINLDGRSEITVNMQQTVGELDGLLVTPLVLKGASVLLDIQLQELMPSHLPAHVQPILPIICRGGWPVCRLHLRVRGRVVH